MRIPDAVIERVADAFAKRRLNRLAVADVLYSASATGLDHVARKMIPLEWLPLVLQCKDIIDRARAEDRYGSVADLEAVIDACAAVASAGRYRDPYKTVEALCGECGEPFTTTDAPSASAYCPNCRALRDLS